MITVFHTTDPHGKLGHLQRTIERASGHSLIAVSGDIRDWDGKASVAQIEATLGDLRKLAAQAAAKDITLTCCSGNHDDWSTPDFYKDYWLDVHEANLQGDFTNAVLKLDGQECLLTCMPWRNYELSAWPAWLDANNVTERRRCVRDLAAQERIEQMLEQGKRWREERGIPWVWLHHNPPSFTTASAAFEASYILKEWIASYRPTAVLCGHTHSAPFQKDGNACDQLDATLVSNPGRTSDQIRFNVIRIERNNGGWVASGKTVAERIPTEEPPEPPERLPLQVGGIPLITEHDEVEEWLLRMRRRPK
jgi:Icc-related predicted phosphoesterase